MDNRYISTTAPTESRLLLIFTGWSTDHNHLRELQMPGWDIAVIYDYSSLILNNAPDFSRYDEIAVIAWSFGVPAATVFLKENQHLPVTCTIAVNGTLYPVDDLRGIPHAVFNATRDTLSQSSLQKFYRRMCGSSALYARWQANLPEPRSIDSLKSELDAIANMADVTADSKLWDHIVISDNDRIIPTENQLHAWEKHPDVRLTDGSHLPDFQAIINEYIRDKSIIGNRFKEAAQTYDSNADAQTTIACHLAEMINKHIATDKLRNILEIGCGTGLFTREYLKSLSPDELQLWDLSHIDKHLPGHHVICDAELGILQCSPSCFDAILSASTIQWFRSPIRFVDRCSRAIRPGGLIALSTFGEDNFAELNPFLAKSGKPLHYLSMEQWRKNIPASLEIIDISDEHLNMSFATPTHLLRHIRLTGVATTQSRRADIASNIIRSGLTTLTYHPIYLILRRK